ncbi:MAG: hypothetical protein ACOC41_03770 [Chitinivibrionales bacterium]
MKKPFLQRSPVFEKRLLQSFLFPVLILTVFSSPHSAQAPVGFQNAEWGMSPQEVSAAAEIGGWQQKPAEGEFPADIDITTFVSDQTIAGYPAQVSFYFFEQKFFQATIRFDFDHLAEVDFNYNVFISVNDYYKQIRAETLTFVNDVYDLLQKKYGKKKPVFKGLDPRHTFARTDSYISQEIWNLRYHPYTYYQRIVSSSYARWDYPKTRIIFSVNLAASQQRFDYTLSLVSLDLHREIAKQVDTSRMQGL